MVDIVTGAAGFIGSHLVAKLLRHGHQVEGLDLNNIDIRKPIIPLVCGDVDTIYHLAGLSNIIPSITNPRDYYETNVTGTFNMLEAARLSGCKKFVYAASASCYGLAANIFTNGEPNYKGSRENERLDGEVFRGVTPQYPYALTKYLGEQLVMHYGKVYGMDVVSLRIFNCYGPNSLTKSAYGAMFNTFLAQKANGKPLTIIGDGTQARDFVYVTDVVEAFILAAEKGSGIYNLGTGIATSINQVAEIIGGERISIPERAGEPKCIYADNSKIRNLGWTPKINIAQGISKMMENLDYWKNAKVWESEDIATETSEWQKRLA